MKSVWKTLPPWPTHVEPKPSVIDKLPAELRLAAYSAHIPDDFKGDTEGLQGVLLSCKLLSDEINCELVKVYLASLNATIAHVSATWDAAFDAPLRINHSGATLANMCISVQIPSGVLPEDPYTPGCGCCTPYEGVEKICRIWNTLLPLLSFRSKMLVFSLYTNAPTKRQQTWHLARELSLLLCCGGLDEPTPIHFGSVLAKRIELDWSAAGGGDLESSFGTWAIKDTVFDCTIDGHESKYDIAFKHTDGSLTSLDSDSQKPTAPAYCAFWKPR